MKAIETVYRGYRFRSRLEARWAVFFDALGLKWEYEPEGYVLPDGSGYLPDFRFTPLVDGRVHTQFVEVKGQSPTAREIEVADQLAKAEGCTLIVVGDPLDARLINLPSSAAWDRIYGDSIGNLAFFVWAFAGFPQEEASYGQTRRAAVAARQARFEHGQVGAPKDWTRVPA